MQKRYMAIWFRHLLTDGLALRRPALKEVPFVLVIPERGRVIITAANLSAEKQGISTGMAAADAKAIVPDLKVIDDIPGQAAKLLKALGGHAQAGRHGFDRLALAGHQQALHVAGGRRASFAAAQRRDQWDHKGLKPLDTLSPLLGIPLHASNCPPT